MGTSRHIEDDETRKESIIGYIERHVESLSAVLILTGKYDSAPGEYTFSHLFAILPKTLVDNIAFISTSSNSDMAWFLFREIIPEALKSSPVFIFDNPIHFDWGLPMLLKHREHGVLNMLVALFDWLDDREPQPAKEIVSLYEKYQSIETQPIALLEQKVREVEIDRLMTRLMTRLKKYSAVSPPSHCLHLALESYARRR